MLDKDTVFANKKEKIGPFEFNEQVAKVFDDMLNRSVPFYAESILRQSQLALDFYQPGTRIYDLGCSHGNLGIQILKQFKDKDLCMIGVDNSEPMIKKYTQRLANQSNLSGIQLICSLMEDINIENASVVLINLTLQFLDIKKRDDLIKTIYMGMNPGGVLLLTEKTTHHLPEFEELEKKYYRSFKLENGYSDLEISQKREALEKVLVSDTIDTHKKRLDSAGFRMVDIWMKWFNFTSFIAIK
ncbi:MAG: carboxy-S-adenosyl-L-methionine synthase CmoA [Pseudomonadota bacterium]